MKFRIETSAAKTGARPVLYESWTFLKKIKEFFTVRGLPALVSPPTPHTLTFSSQAVLQIKKKGGGSAVGCCRWSRKGNEAGDTEYLIALQKDRGGNEPEKQPHVI